MQEDAGKGIPDTATTYERAKPAKESPSGKLANPPARKDEQPDVLKDNANPSSPRPSKSE